MSQADRLLAAILPPSAALALARRLMKAAGVGHGGIVSHSGEMAAMQKALAMTRCGDAPVLFDVGANVGAWTLAAKTRWPGAKVHAFEPSQAHLALLHKAVDSLPDVRVTGAALGREQGPATLFKDREVTGLASMTKRDLSHAGIAMETQEAITVETLDGYCAAQGIDHVDYLKIDVEGHELDVLEGGRGLLEKRAIGAVQFEFGGCNIDTRTFLRDFFSLFETYGYALYLCGPGGGLHQLTRYREFSEQFSTTNYVAVSQGR